MDHTHWLIHTYRTGLPFAFLPENGTVYARGMGGPGDFDVIRMDVEDSQATVSTHVYIYIYIYIYIYMM